MIKFGYRDIKLYILCGVIVSVMPSCFPPVEDNQNDIPYSLKDPMVKEIFDLKDRHQTDSLLNYLQHKKAAYRYVSALAFASFKDSKSVPALVKLLNDRVEEVRQAAVFSLGQSTNVDAEIPLINAFIAVDSAGAFQKTNGMILEALGKCGSDSTLHLICNITSYLPKDTFLLYGQMSAFYRFGLREKYCKESLDKILLVATSDNFPVSARLMAAHCLQRIKIFDLSNHLDVLKKACKDEKNVDIRMCLVSALSRNTSIAALTAMEELYSRGLDIRIQANIVKGLLQHNGTQARFFALKALQNPSLHVSGYAAQFLLDKGNPDIAEELKNLTERTNLPWQIKSIVFQAALKHIPTYLVLTRQAIEYKLLNHIQQAKNPYEKAAYLKAFSYDSKQLHYFLAQAKGNLHPFVRNTITESIEKILSNPDFTFVYKGSRNYVYYALSEYFTKQCELADPGTLAIISSIFSKPQYNLLKIFDADSLLSIAQSKLSLPKDIETYNEVEKCLAGLRKTKFVAKTPEYNNPIQWNLLDNYGDTIYAVIATNKGDIGIELYPGFAPASVINFIRLVKDGFYSDKVFHRVVANFVVQVGCPRGDGYGALDYTIRTDISMLNYQESGMIGMASAGLDTEGTQFFITHSPTPHLDGRYSIFGKMKSGNEVLLNLSQSDFIKSIQLN